MFETKEEYLMPDSNTRISKDEKWQIYWIGFMEGRIHDQSITGTNFIAKLNDLKQFARDQFNKTFCK